MTVNWAGLTDGYREFFDPRPLNDRFRSGRGVGSAWDKVWDRLHHQGDVGTASYAVLPAIAECYSTRTRTWEPYAYASTLEECREDKRNPDMPDWLDEEYDHALIRIREYAFEDLRQRQPTGVLTCILAFLAAQSGSLGLAAALNNLDACEHALELLGRYGDSLGDT